MFSSRYLVLFVALLLVSCTSTPQETPPDGHTIEGLSHPESVAHDSENDVFYATNFGSELAPEEKDGEGFISRLATDGTIETLRYLPTEASDATLHAPKGTVVMNGRLYTADIDRIVGFDLEEREQIAEVSLEGEEVSFLNDIAVMDDQTLLVSETNQGRIYRVDLEEETATALDVEIPGANGLVYSESDGELYAVTFGGEQGGALWTITLTEDGEVNEASSRTLLEGGQFDGIVMQSDDQLLISDWGVEGDDEAAQALHVVGTAESDSLSTIELTDWQGPADFSCAAGACWIPDLPASVVHIVRPGQRMD